MKKFKTGWAIGLGVLTLLAPAAEAAADRHERAGAGGAARAVAVLRPTKGNDVRGVVTFLKVEGGIKVTALIEGLRPGPHGFHIHDWGDCSASDAASAGGHFNPAGAPHGGPDAAKRHAGDLGNLIAGKTGIAHYERLDRHAALEGAGSIAGRSVIVHERADDFKTQPAGDAGGRLACGVIGIAAE